MTNFIPIFPLPIVVFPGEKLNLHIFEPRYIQLVNDCFQNNKPFGIPSVINGKVSELGTVVTILSIEKIHENGTMDIKTLGEKVFQTLELIREIPDKLYSGAIVTYPENIMNSSIDMMKKIMHLIERFYNQIGTKKDFGKETDQLISYDVAHYIGLNMLEEYDILGYLNELHRQEYIKRHLIKLSPAHPQVAALQHKIQLNGHFKNIQGFDF